jgi:hypothetical protein
VNFPSRDNEECARIQSLYTTNTLDSEPGYYTQPNWANCQKTNKGCELDFTNPSNSAAYNPSQTCYQGESYARKSGRNFRLT